MESEWSTLPLDNALEALIDYRGKSPPKSVEGVPVISAKIVKDGRVLYPVEQRIDPNYYQVWMTRGLPEVGDVVMTTEGPLGEVAQLDSETAKYALGQRIVCMRGKKGVLDNTFLKFLLISPRQQTILQSFATGTTVEGISQKALRAVPISIPAYTEQVAIGNQERWRGAPFRSAGPHSRSAWSHPAQLRSASQDRILMRSSALRYAAKRFEAPGTTK